MKSRLAEQARQAQLADIRRMTVEQRLMAYLTRALDDPDAGACGRCANCRGGPLLPATCSDRLANEAAIFLRRSYQPLLPRRQCLGGESEAR